MRISKAVRDMVETDLCDIIEMMKMQVIRNGIGPQNADRAIEKVRRVGRLLGLTVEITQNLT